MWVWVIGHEGKSDFERATVQRQRGEKPLKCILPLLQGEHNGRHCAHIYYWKWRLTMPKLKRKGLKSLDNRISQSLLLLLFVITYSIIAKKSFMQRCLLLPGVPMREMRILANRRRPCDWQGQNQHEWLGFYSQINNTSTFFLLQGKFRSVWIRRGNFDCPVKDIELLARLQEAINGIFGFYCDFTSLSSYILCRYFWKTQPSYLQ